MTAQSIGIFTIDFPDPNAIDYDNNKFNTINDTLGFQDRIQSAIQTLSTKDVDAGTDPYGLLYVPDLQSDACRASEHDYVPANATRLHNLPLGKDYALIALAPWYNGTCMTEYFAAARQAPTKAVLVYQPGQSNAKPPVLNDPSWNLNDGGAWQTANTFPTYALSPVAGSIVMNQLNRYSANITNVPNGQQLASVYNASDYIRLWASVNTDTSSQLPSLWVFLVIVMAILLVAVTTTSVAMHVIQRGRRRALQQRVVSGEVDLEALGVKRLNVSQQVLDELPIYTYTTGNREALEKTSSEIPTQPADPPSSTMQAETNDKTSVATRPLSESTLPTNTMSTSWSQPTCPICLDDFVVDETQVRELPCHHVFHPDCIDTFLLRNSSLCPLCKQTVLPKGDCPVIITNVMVRRERHITRMRARSANGNNAQQGTVEAATTMSRFSFLSRLDITSKLGRLFRRNPTSIPPSQTQPGTSDIEMANADTTPPQVPEIIPATEAPPTAAPAQDCEPSRNRREWANQRALALLGQRNAPASDIGDETRSVPKWKRIFRKIFPGFR